VPKLPRITGEELLAALEKEGFRRVRRHGSHLQVKKYVNDRKITFPVPVHRGKILKPGTLKGILRKAEITVDRLIELL